MYITRNALVSPIPICLNYVKKMVVSRKIYSQHDEIHEFLCCGAIKTRCHSNCRLSIESAAQNKAITCEKWQQHGVALIEFSVKSIKQNGLLFLIAVKSIIQNDLLLLTTVKSIKQNDLLLLIAVKNKKQNDLILLIAVKSIKQNDLILLTAVKRAK